MIAKTDHRVKENVICSIIQMPSSEVKNTNCTVLDGILMNGMQKNMPDDNGCLWVEQEGTRNGGDDRGP